MPIERDELPRVLWSVGYFFFVLSSYFILRPLREALGLAKGSAWLDELYVRTFLAMLIAAPVFAFLATRFSKRQFLPWVYHLATLMLVAFAVLFRWFPEWTQEYTAGIFFNWLSVYNLFAVSVFWSVMADVFTAEQGKRLFATIAVGGTLGALVGSLVTAALVKLLGTSGLIVASAVLLQLGVVCLWRLIRHSGRAGATPLHGGERVGGTTWSGLREMARSVYLQGIALYILIGTVTATVIYFTLSLTIESIATTEEARASLFASINLWSQATILVVQLFITSRALRGLGVGITLALLPVFYVLGFGLLGLIPAFLTIGLFEVSRKAILHGVAKPTKELLFTLVSDEARYKSKNFMDTVVYRGGDVLGAQLMARFKEHGFSVRAMAWSTIPLCAVWILVSLGLGRRARSATSGAAE